MQAVGHKTTTNPHTKVEPNTWHLPFDLSFGGKSAGRFRVGKSTLNEHRQEDNTRGGRALTITARYVFESFVVQPEEHQSTYSLSVAFLYTIVSHGTEPKHTQKHGSLGTASKRDLLVSWPPRSPPNTQSVSWLALWLVSPRNQSIRAI